MVSSNPDFFTGTYVVASYAVKLAQLSNSSVVSLRYLRQGVTFPYRHPFYS